MPGKLPMRATGCCYRRLAPASTCSGITTIGVISSAPWWRHCDAGRYDHTANQDLGRPVAAAAGVGGVCGSPAGGGCGDDLLGLHGYGRGHPGQWLSLCDPAVAVCGHGLRRSPDCGECASELVGAQWLADAGYWPGGAGAGADATGADC